MEPNSPALSRRLSGLDAAFLYLERKELPLNVAGVCIFDGPIPFEAFVADVKSKLDLLPRFRQVVVPPPFNIGYPTWEDDLHFDIRRHIFRAHLSSPGADPELEELAGRILSQMMDRGKPLWDIHVVDGLKGRRGALIVRMHHALADGVAGASLVKILLDSTPKPVRRAMRKAEVPQPSQHSVPSLQQAIGEVVYNILDHLLSAEKGLLDFAQALPTERMRSGFASLTSLAPELICAVERLPFNKRCTGERKFCWAQLDFRELQSIRAVSGGTINDIVLSVLTRAIARYTELHGQSVPNRMLRVVVPVNLRDDNGGSMGNQISFLPVVLPMDEKDPVGMVRQATARMETMKKVKAAEMLALVANCLGATPPSFQAMIWGGLPDVTLPLPLFNIICTNVPGSAEPLYSVGRRMIACYPQVPTGYDLGVGCAVLSYAGNLFIGLIADAQVVPDVARLRDFFCLAYEELRTSAGIPRSPVSEPEPRVKKRARRAAPRAVKSTEPTSVEAESVAPAPLPAKRRRPRSNGHEPAGPVAPPSPEPETEVAAAAGESQRAMTAGGAGD